MKRSNKVVFFGNERLATAVTTSTPTLGTLVDAGYEIPAVVTSYAPGVSRETRQLEIMETAKAHDIPLLIPQHPGEILAQLKSYGAEAAVLVAYGRIIPAEIIGLFPRGIINIHPSLLPRYRGPTPVEQTILDGAKESGVSLMKLVPKMDAGPVYAQAKLAVNGDETKQQLADGLLNLGSKLLIEKLAAILDGSLAPQPQDDSQATYTKLLKKADGVVDWSKPAQQLEREVRAYAGWPKSQASIHGQEVIITKVRIAKSQEDGALVMKCGSGYLEITELVGPSGRKMAGADFLRGYSSPAS